MSAPCGVPVQVPITSSTQHDGNTARFGGIHNQQRPELLNVPPRRRRPTSRQPIFEIFDDASLLSGRQTSTIPPSRDISTSMNEHTVDDLARRTSLLSVAPRRPGLSAMNSNAANITRRRTSVINANSTAILSPTNRSRAQMRAAEEDTQRVARRRTIYVPADDTTIMTIHPGASYSRRIAQATTNRQSDVFLDLATLTESSLLQGHEQGCLSPPVQRPLAVTPRRAPLRRVSRQLQAAACNTDVPGSGGGKENVPPGMSGDKEKLITTRGPRKASMPISISDGRYPQRIYSQAIQRTPVQQIPEPSDPITITPVRISITQPPSPFTNRARTLKKASQSQKAAFSPRCSAIRLSRQPEWTPTKISVPVSEFRNARCLEQYPVLAEHIDNPDLYEDNWLSRQEAAITGLVNELFEACNFPKASSALSSSSLRKKLLTLHDNQATSSLHSRLQASLRFGGLSVSNEALLRVSRIKDDLGQSRKYLDLFLKTYNQSLLQAAAEVIIGREAGKPVRGPIDPSGKISANSPRQHNRALETFLTRCLLRNEDYIPSTSISPSSKVAATLIDDVGTPAWLWRRTVTRSLLLVLLIDRAALSACFQGCVFQTSSPHKSSAAVLQALMSLLLPSLGGASRVLSRLSYEVTHVQRPLHEYSYKIDNLAIDLRDGIRLTKVVELLLPPTSTANDEINQDLLQLGFNPLSNADKPSGIDSPECRAHKGPVSNLLKHPCTGRIQKLSNVQLALDALGKVGSVDNVLEHVTAKDIVDGHREKTVGLLWSVVSRWGLGLLVNFEFLEAEIKRLKQVERISAARNRHKHALTTKQEEVKTEDVVLSTTDPLSLDRQTSLLLSWARHVAGFRNITIDNLSTSFANGHAYQAIAEEYKHYIPGAQVIGAPGALPSSKVEHRAVTIQDTLRSFGCSKSFIALFPAWSSSETGEIASSIPTKQTTIPLLAFLASRLLPLAQPHIAALTLQRWWRNLIRVKAAKQMWGANVESVGEFSTGNNVWKTRTIKAKLARECRDVVHMRIRIERATIVLQRWWRNQNTRSKLGGGKRPSLDVWMGA